MGGLLPFYRDSVSVFQHSVFLLILRYVCWKGRGALLCRRKRYRNELLLISGAINIYNSLYLLIISDGGYMVCSVYLYILYESFTYSCHCMFPHLCYTSI